MWTRKELKEKAKIRFKANYWKAVLVALILSVVLGGGANLTHTFDRDDFNKVVSDERDNNTDGEHEYMYDMHYDSLSEMKEALIREVGADLPIVIAVVACVFFAIVVISICVKVFALNPLQVGGRKFFIENLADNAELSGLGAGFKNNYLSNVKTMFLMDLFTGLWALLFIIPGIIKSYEYRMIPYLIADNPEMTTEEAFAKSKEMMMGNKWDTFVLDLSFIGWALLSALTLGILSVFYVNPYIYQTDAALYEKLSGGNVSAEYGTYVEVE